MKSSYHSRKKSRSTRQSLRRVEALEARRLMAGLPPDALNDLYQVQADQALSIASQGVLANDVSYGGTLTAQLFSGPSHGTLTLADDGSFSYTPNSGYIGLDSFVYYANDGELDSLLAAVTLRVSTDGGAPTTQADTYTLKEDTTLGVTAPAGVLANDVANGGEMSAEMIVGPEHGAIAFNPDGSFTYTPAANFNGVDSFTYQARTGEAVSEPTTVTLTVNPINDRPASINDAYAATEDGPLVADTNGVLANDSDLDGDTLTAQLVSGPQNGSVELNADGTFTYTPSADFHGIDGFSYVAHDGTVASQVATVTISVASVNDAPLAAADAYEVSEDTSLIVEAAGVLGNDTDGDGDPLTAALLEGPQHGTLTLNPDGSFSYTPNPDFHGSDSFTYQASDGGLVSAATTVSLTVTPVNDAPLANNDEYTLEEDTELLIAADGILANDTDADGDPLTALLVAGPQNGTLTLNPDGSFSYVPNSDFHGVDGFSYMTGDGTEESAVATVTINVTPVNDAPLAAGDAYEIDEDATLVVDPSGLLANDSDADGDTLTAVLVEGPQSGTLTLNPDGSFSYTPLADFHGSDSFTYQVSDGTTASDLAIVSITVNPINDTPLANNDEYTVDEDAELVVTDSILENDTDADGDELTAVMVDGPQNGTLTLNPDGTFNYLPDPDFSGVDGFSYLVNDGTTESAVATVTINVTSLNDAPLAADDAYEVAEDATLVIDPSGILANDTDGDGDPLTAELVAGPQHGTLTLNPDGSFSYTPSADFNGSDSFTYQASDGTTVSTLATVAITVSSVNDAPLAANDEYTVEEDAALVVEADGILANDSDADGDILSAALVDGPQNGTLTLNPDGSFNYTPDANFSGVDGFSYLVSDGTEESSVATVTITVTPTNDAPLANNDEYTIDEDTELSIEAAGILANDSDPEGDALAAALVSGPQNGTLTLNPDGSFSYLPNADFNGVDGFSYLVSDGAAESAVATVTINVTPVNDGPLATDDVYSAIEDETLVIDPQQGLLANDSDPEGDPLTVIILSPPTAGTVIANDDGSFTYTPLADFHGNDTFTYLVTDGTTESNVATVSIEVAGVNDAPLASDASYEMDEDATLTVEAPGLLSGASDVEGDPLTAVLVSGPQNGTLTLNPDGSFSYTPVRNFFGTDTFTYAASDGGADSAEATVVITINPLPDAPKANDDAYSIGEDHVLAPGAAQGVLTNDFDPEGMTLTAELVAEPERGTLVFNSDGSFSYTPDENYHGGDSFSYIATNGVEASEVRTVAITVEPINDWPVATVETYDIPADSALIIDAAEGVLANDADIDGDALTARLLCDPLHGALEMNEDGSFSYTPNAGFTGEDYFYYQASDGKAYSNVIRVVINVGATSGEENSAPQGSADSYSVISGQTLAIDGPGVLANDSDADGDPLTASLVAGPANGSLTLENDGSLSYTPDEGFVGSDSFTYAASDGAATSGPVTVTINVTDPDMENVAPASASDSFVTSVDTPLVISAAGVLANDTDANGDALSALLVDGPAHGTLALAADGSFSYTPAAGYSGVDTFTYQATDGAASGNVATVTITIVSGDNSRPNAVNDQYGMTADQTLDIAAAGVLANDSDAQGQTLTAHLFSAPQHGTVSLAADGSFAYTPNAGFVGLDSFIYRAFDGQSYSALAAVTIRISPAQAPLAALALDGLALEVVAEGQHNAEDMAGLVDELFADEDWLL